MLLHYLKILLRHNSRHKGFALINLAGLVIGTTVCMQIFIFVKYEIDFDGAHKNNIYRVYENRKEAGDIHAQKIGQTAFPLAPALKAAIPEIKNYARVIVWENTPFTAEGREPVTGTAYAVDNSFLDMFNFPMLRGNKNSALQKPNSIILTEDFSKRMFGNNDPVGIRIRNEGRDTTEFLVTGVLHNIPAQSHLQFDALYSRNTIGRLDSMNDWSMSWMFTYLELTEDAGLKNLEHKITGIFNSHLNKESSISSSLFLQKLDQVHLYSNGISRDFLNTKKFNGGYIIPLVAIALIVLIMAIINYINLNIAQSFTRAKEVAVRKTSGAGRNQVALQFFLETIFVSMVALLISIFLIQLLLPLFSRLSGRVFTLNLWTESGFLLIFGGIAVITGVLSGIFPALAISNLQPVRVLKGNIWLNPRSSLRHALVIIQFTASIALTMISMNVFRQLKYIRNYDTGFSSNNVIVIPVAYTDREKEIALIEQIRQTRGVSDATGALRRLGKSIDRNQVIFEGENENALLQCSTMFVDFNYCSFYKIPFLAGRDLSPVYGADRKRQSYIINETLARMLISKTKQPTGELNTLIGKNFRYQFDDEFGKIVGIVRDFNFNSLHQKIEPLCMTYQDEYYFSDLSVRIDLQHVQQSLSTLESVWKKHLPNQPFSYYFLDKQLEQLYMSETQTSMFVAIFASLSFAVACLGIIAMTAFNLRRRVKEIGVRKVLGAGIESIVVLLSVGFIKLIFVSIIIAIPIAWLVTELWMQNFAYRAGISWTLFFFTGLSAICIALLTIGFQTIKAARANPVESLRTE